METMSRSLVVYYSLSGNTERVALDVAQRLGADIEAIVDRQNRKGVMGYLRSTLQAALKKASPIEPPGKQASRYAVTIIGTPVWCWNLTPSIRAYLEQTKDHVNEVAFFVTSGDTDAERVAPFVEEVLGQDLIAYQGFNARELRDEAVYQRKLDDFVRSIRDRARPAGVENAVVI